MLLSHPQVLLLHQRTPQQVLNGVAQRTARTLNLLEWTMQEWTYQHGMARVDNAGVDNAGADEGCACESIRLSGPSPAGDR